MGSWGCPHEFNGLCQKVLQRECDPGMKGCVLYGRVVFANPEKNPPPRPAVNTQPAIEPGSTDPSKD
jgi:hypothetical protein